MKFNNLVISPEGLEAIQVGKSAPKGAISLRGNNKINWLPLYLEHCKQYKPIKVNGKLSPKKTLEQFDTLAKNLTILIANTGRSNITNSMPVFIPPLMQMYELPYEMWDFEDAAMPYMLGNLNLYSSIKALRDLGEVEYDIHALREHHITSINSWKLKKYVTIPPFVHYLHKLTAFQVHLLCKSWVLHSRYDSRMISNPWKLDEKIEENILFNELNPYFEEAGKSL